MCLQTKSPQDVSVVATACALDDDVVLIVVGDDKLGYVFVLVQWAFSPPLRVTTVKVYVPQNVGDVIGVFHGQLPCFLVGWRVDITADKAATSCQTDAPSGCRDGDVEGSGDMALNREVALPSLQVKSGDMFKVLVA